MTTEDANIAKTFLDADYADVFGVCGKGDKIVIGSEVLEVDNFIVVAGESAEDREGDGSGGSGEGIYEEGLVVVN